MKVVKFKGGQMIRVTPDEALRIIASLSEQIRANNPNGNREEFQAEGCGYFSIAVHSEPKPEIEWHPAGSPRTGGWTGGWTEERRNGSIWHPFGCVCPNCIKKQKENP